MELWAMWTHLLEAGIGLLAARLGLSEAIAIIVLTLIARAAMLPVSLVSAYNMQVNKEAIARLKPALDPLRERLEGDPTGHHDMVQLSLLQRDHALQPSRLHPVLPSSA